MEENLNLNIPLSEIREALCPKCQDKLKDITKDHIAEALAKRALEAEPGGKK